MRNTHFVLSIVGILVAVTIIFFVVQALIPRELEAPETETTREQRETQPAWEVVAENLEIPWDIAFLPDGTLLVTERPGRLLRIGTDGTRISIPIEGVKTGGEGGLLGLTLHPDFENNNWLYLYMGTPAEGGGTMNRVERYVFTGDTLTDRTLIIDDIPGARFHDGGRIEFGPPTACASGQADCHLYIATGDATKPLLAQNTESLAGKVLRINDDGSVPTDNPFGFAQGKPAGHSAVYSYGHRNPQGLAWDDGGRLWLTEHGRSGIRSGLDEVNLITAGANYGWPDSQGDDVETGTVAPVRHSGPDVTWAPASAAYLPAQAGLDGSLFFGGLRGETLYEAVLKDGQITDFREHFVGMFGRIRTVRVGPDGFLYITTSNRDGRGNIREGDDKIIRINPKGLGEL